MRTILPSIAGLMCLTGCYAAPQYSSGADYLGQNHAAVVASALKAKADGGAHALTIDERVTLAAAVEPNLRLPGRFGLARIVNGRLTAIPSSEATLWRDLATEHSDFGTFTPVSPLIASLATPRDPTRWSSRRSGRTIEEIRIGAARQHLDTVLIYEVGARADKNNTALALMDLTIIGGAFLPTRHIKAQGQANAILIDVRNGYPYGTASAVSDLSAYFTSWGSDKKRDEMQQAAIHQVVKDLTPEVEALMLDLQRIVLASNGSHPKGGGG